MKRARSRALVNPYATAGLAIALAVAVCLTSPAEVEVLQPTNGFRTITVGNAVINQHVTGMPIERFVVRERGTLRLINPNEESWDEVTKQLTTDASNILHLRHIGYRKRTGVWAATREIEEERIELEYGSGFSPEERAQARLMYIDQVLAPQWHPWRWLGELDRLRAGDVYVSRTLWGGHAFNAAQALLLLGLLWSGLWIRHLPAWTLAYRRARALHRGRCPRCRYSIAALPEPRCPECGEDLTPTPPVRARG